MSAGLDQVAAFLANSSDAVVVDVHSFSKKWTGDVHADFQRLIRAKLGRWIVRPDKKGWAVTLGEILGSKALPEKEGRVLIIYQVLILSSHGSI